MSDRKYLLVAVIATIAILGAISYFMFNKADSPEDVPILQFVSGTEYVSGEEGQVIVEARFSNGTSAINTCNLTTWYPDKTLFFNVPGNISVSGNAYTVFTVPGVDGIYEYQASCLYVNGRSGIISKSFHVSAFQNNMTAQAAEDDARIYAEIAK